MGNIHVMNLHRGDSQALSLAQCISSSHLVSPSAGRFYSPFLLDPLVVDSEALLNCVLASFDRLIPHVATLEMSPKTPIPCEFNVDGLADSSPWHSYCCEHRSSCLRIRKEATLCIHWSQRPRIPPAESSRSGKNRDCACWLVGGRSGLA
jgi:hypothetical protein